MKKSVVSALLCCGLTALLLTGCSQSGTAGSAYSSGSSEQSSAQETETTKVNPKDNAEVTTSNLDMTELKVNLTSGMSTKSYNVPFTVDQLTADGFEVEFKSGSNTADTSGTDHIEKAFIKYMNIPSFEVLSGTREILDIYGVDTSKSQSKEPVLVSFSMNGATVGCGSTYDDLVAVFGEPDEIYRDEDQIYLCKYYSDCKVSDEILKGAQSGKVVEHQLDFNHTTGNITSLTAYFYAGGNVINDFELRLGYYDSATGTGYRFY